MKLTLNRLKWYEKIKDECRYLAEDFNNITRDYGIDLRVDEDADVSVNVKKQYIEVDGSYNEYSEGGYKDYHNYCIQIPFGFIEDPIAWEDQWEVKKHQELCDALQKKIDDKKKKEDQLEAHDRREFERLKEKYSETLQGSGGSQG